MLEKWNVLGNDFLITRSNFTKKEIIKLSDRNFGIGCDQFIIFHGNEVQFFNSDGSESGMCGNGLKCIAEIVSRETGQNNFFLKIKNKNVEVKMEKGIPALKIGKPTKVKKELNPFLNLNVPDFLKDENCQFYYLELGNPHFVSIINTNVKNFFSSPEVTNSINTAGRFLQEKYPKTKGVNASFVLRENNKKILVRTFERGVGETLSCGSGACASFFSCFKSGLVSRETKVFNKGSEKVLEISKTYSLISVTENNEIWLKGQGEKIGEIILAI